MSILATVTVEKNRQYAKIPSNYRKTQQNQVDNFVKQHCSFFYRHIEELERK